MDDDEVLQEIVLQASMNFITLMFVRGRKEAFDDADIKGIVNERLKIADDGWR
jgi:hypothetical protein